MRALVVFRVARSMSNNVVFSRWFTVAVGATVLAGCAVLLSQRQIDPDLWGHIQYAEDWLASGTLPRTATHTWADPEYRWINHENLSELILALAHRLLGGAGLMAAKTLLGIGVLMLIWWNARRDRVEPFTAFVCLVPVAIGLATYWAPRPQLASFVLFTLMMCVLRSVERRSASDGRFRGTLLWLNIPLMVIWANAHGGFLAGLAVLSLWTALQVVRLIGFGDGPGRFRTAGFAAATALAAGAATLINPYGPDLHRWLLGSLRVPRPEISEWVSLMDDPRAWIPWLLLTAGALVAFVLTKRRRDGIHLILFAVVAVVSFRHVRHLAFLAILFGFVVPLHLQSAAERLLRGRRSPATADSMTPEKAWPVLLTAGMGVLLLSMVSVRQWWNFGVPRDEYPVSAVRFLADNRLHGRLVVTYDWAQYAMAALAPETTVGFDGRFRTCYPQFVVDMHFDFILGNVPGHRCRAVDSGPFDPERVLEFGHPDLVLIDRIRDPSAVQVMSGRTDWVCLYQDSISQVWGRRDLYDNPDSPWWVPESRRRVTEAVQAGVAPWPALPGRSGRLAFAETARQALLQQTAQQTSDPVAR